MFLISLVLPSGRSSAQQVMGPATWVAFSSEFKQVDPNGAAATGRWYQASDGSSRNETSYPDRSTIRITNITLVRYFVHRTDKDSWTSHPMILPPGGWKPRQELPKGTRPAEPIGDSAGFAGLAAFRVFRGESASIVVPALNFFEVVRTLGETGRVEHFNVKLGDPDPALFLPPFGATVTEVSKPAGIVWSETP